MWNEEFTLVSKPLAVLGSGVSCWDLHTYPLTVPFRCLFHPNLTPVQTDLMGFIIYRRRDEAIACLQQDTGYIASKLVYIVTKAMSDRCAQPTNCKVCDTYGCSVYTPEPGIKTLHTCTCSYTQSLCTGVIFGTH